uniref:Secreted protein n=1 Tax=Arundo donax TaxID=35708 RepID=A0A0A8YS14_ARUDO
MSLHLWVSCRCAMSWLGSVISVEFVLSDYQLRHSWDEENPGKFVRCGFLEIFVPVRICHSSARLLFRSSNISKNLWL